METLFSTDGFHPRHAFRRWREMFCERLAPVNLHVSDEASFQGRVEATSIGSMLISRSSHTATRVETTAETVRRSGKQDRVHVILRLSGQETIRQGDQEAVCRAGDFVVLGPRPLVSMAETGTKLVLDLPRDRFETMLGPSRLFSALTVGANFASTPLASTYIKDLIAVSDRFSPEAATRMASIGIDLLVASLSERMAQEVPRSIHGSVTVQRAKAYVEANLGDPSLDPPQLAAAMGLSLRRLQELFHEHGRHISDHIWERRLEVAAKRLSDPACAHLSIGMLAYGCGFSSQAHFARRFKDCYGMSPRDYRQARRQDVQSVASAFGRSSRST